jgi:hypothetical protein
VEKLSFKEKKQRKKNAFYAGNRTATESQLVTLVQVGGCYSLLPVLSTIMKRNSNMHGISAQRGPVMKFPEKVRKKNSPLVTTKNHQEPFSPPCPSCILCNDHFTLS